LDNFLREVAGQATASRIYLEEVAFKRGEEKFAHSVRSQLESVEKEASRLVKALRGDIGRRFSRQVYEMHLNLPEPAKLPAGDEKIEHRLLTSALELTKEGVEALMRFPRAPRPRCGVSPNRVEISSAGSWLCISPERALLFTIGDVPMELWVAPPPEEAEARWLHPLQLKEVRVSVRESDRVQVKGKITLFGRNTRVESKYVHAEFVADVRRDSRLIMLDLRIVNDGQPYECYAFLTPGLSWQTDTTKGTLPAWEAPSQREVTWVYLHRSKEGGGGILLTRLPTIGTSQGRFYIFGREKRKHLEKGEAFDLSITVAPIWMPLSRDEFLLECLENVRRYAKLASGLLTQSRLQWR
jgi:hypothetical protein